MTSPETRTQPFDMVPEDEPRQRRGSMVDDATFGDMREGRRGSNGSDDQLPLSKSDRRMYELTHLFPIIFITQPTNDIIDHSLTTIYYRSKEWDASKTPPSRFQKVEGSVCSPSPARGDFTHPSQS